MHCSINKDSGDRAPVPRAACIILQLPLAPPAVYECLGTFFFNLNYICKSGEAYGEERHHINVLSMDEFNYNLTPPPTSRYRSFASIGKIAFPRPLCTHALQLAHKM